jgi:hypothetical protein
MKESKTQLLKRYEHLPKEVLNDLLKKYSKEEKLKQQEQFNPVYTKEIIHVN